MEPTELRPLTPIAGSLALVSSLAAVAGCLDALSLDRLTGTFVAFQSGDTSNPFVLPWIPLLVSRGSTACTGPGDVSRNGAPT